MLLVLRMFRAYTKGLLFGVLRPGPCRLAVRQAAEALAILGVLCFGLGLAQLNQLRQVSWVRWADGWVAASSVICVSAMEVPGQPAIHMKSHVLRCLKI